MERELLNNRERDIVKQNGRSYAVQIGNWVLGKYFLDTCYPLLELQKFLYKVIIIRPASAFKEEARRPNYRLNYVTCGISQR